MTTLAEQLKHGADQAWESLSAGWRELRPPRRAAPSKARPPRGAATRVAVERGGSGRRASGALTRFWTTPADPSVQPSKPPMLRDPTHRLTGWAFMAVDAFDDDDKVVVRVEAPGMRREDFKVELNGRVLTVGGEKRIDEAAGGGRWQIAQCAYGSFRRDVVLPATVRADKTKASYRDGVLRIELPKSDEARARRVAVQTA